MSSRIVPQLDANCRKTHNCTLHCRYMEKLAVGPTVNPRAVSLNKSIASNIRAVAEAKGEASSRAWHHSLHAVCCA